MDLAKCKSSRVAKIPKLMSRRLESRIVYSILFSWLIWRQSRSKMLRHLAFSDYLGHEFLVCICVYAHDDRRCCIPQIFHESVR